LRLVVGLGNPGERYRRTRHNVGFMVADAFGRRVSAKVLHEAHEASISEFDLGGERAYLVKPLTFMNRSGAAVARILDATGSEASEVVVVLDDFALELGALRIREKGGHGGHNGLRSLIDTLGSEEFPRVRVGIGLKETGDLPAYVLSEFEENEVLVVQETVGRAAEAVECVLREGTGSAMNKFNGPRP
jgi:PTH1 family peptidyl-tRNA hydrolase